MVLALREAVLHEDMASYRDVLPERLAVTIAKQEFVVTTLDLARKDRIHALVPDSHSRDFDHIPFLKNKFVLTNELRKRQVHLDQAAIRLSQRQVRAESAAHRTLTVMHIIDRPLEHCLCGFVVFRYCRASSFLSKGRRCT
jgi:hypothetical protein